MKKYLHLIAALILTVSSAFSQALYEDDFESYNAGDYLAVENPTWWTTWSGLPGSGEDAVISSDYANSGVNSAKVAGTTDAILMLGNKTSGKYQLTFKILVPTGFGGYYNFQHYESPGIEWAFEVYFGATGAGYLNAGSNSVAGFNYAHDTWIEVANVIDLTNDWTELYIDGNLIYEWPFSWQASTQSGLLQMGGVDFYAGAPTGETATYYFEDMVFESVPEALYEDDFESYIAGGYMAVQNPDWWTTWSGSPGSTEDATISTDQALSGVQSVKIEGVTDLLLKLGNKTSGKFELKFHYYIPSGFGGYFNIQHFESPGIEWAYEIYFGATGGAYLNAGANSVTGFDFDHDTWMEIDNIIDLNADWTELYVDGVLIYEWPFSWQASTQSGTLQLGGMDVYAGAPTGETPKFYMDDLALIQLESGIGAPVINVSPTSITESLFGGQTSSQTLTIGNVGELDLDYDIYVNYTNGSKASTVSQPISSHEVILSNISMDPTPKPGGSPEPSDDVILHYDGDNASAVGLTDGGEMRVSAVFTPAELAAYAGMELTSVELYINEAPIATKIQVYNYGLPNIPGPGDLLLEQTFSSLATSWNTVNLSTPILIGGFDIWVGYWVNHTAGTYPAGCDAGPHDPNGDWISAGPGWHHLSDNVALDYNWNIRAHLTGDPMIQWLSASPSSGTVAVGAATDVDVNFDASALAVGSYNADLIVNNNDPENPQIIIGVTLDVLVGINENDKIGVMIYPNPVVDFVNVKSDHKILSVELISMMGQRIEWKEINASQGQISTSDLQPGTYILKVDMENGTVTKRITVN
jgi:hypothetical protein